MSGVIIPRRSVLYVPGGNERALQKAKRIPADALILDLEDAVAPEAKQAARQRVCQALQEWRDGEYRQRELTVRVNGIGTPWHSGDLRAITAAAPAAVIVPKTTSGAELHAIDRELANSDIAVWAMIETAAALLNLSELAIASERLSVLVMGTNDLAAELRVEDMDGREPLLTALQLCVIAARAHGLVILDGVHNQISDPAGFMAECRQGRQLGFDGKTLIHPDQVGPCNRVFAPSEQQIAHSRAVLAAWEAAQAENLGITTLNGQMIEELHVRRAEQILAIAKTIAQT